MVFQIFWSISFWTRRGLRLVRFGVQLPVLVVAATTATENFLFFFDDFRSDSEEIAAAIAAATRGGGRTAAQEKASSKAAVSSVRFVPLLFVWLVSSVGRSFSPDVFIFRILIMTTFSV